jgi:lipopolysaccharide export system protein LptA
MTILPFKMRPHWAAMVRVAAVMLIISLPPNPVRAAEPETKAKGTPIEITADRLVTDNVAKSADFTGKVRAVQGDTQITADRLILFYGDTSGKTASLEGGSIKRMEAYGQVRITFDNRLAVSDQAVYITSERKLVLKGPGSRVTSGKDQIEGTKITFYRNDGRIALEGNADNRVKVTIHSEQRGLN